MTPGVPLLDPLPLPAPAWLLSALLALTFTLHLVPMNLLLGGSILAFVARVRGRREPHAATLAHLIAKALPIVFAATVTLGVAALLFLQALYGRVFFPATVLLAVPWILIVPLIVVAYYGAYREAALSQRPGPDRRGPGALMIAAPVLAVAFIQANVMSLLLRPQAFGAMFFGDASGLSLSVDDPTLVPRFLHTLLGALAVTGVTSAIVGLAKRRQDAEFGNWMIRHGSLLAAWSTLANLVPGLWWLAVLPGDIVRRFMGRDVAATAWLAVGVVAGLAVIGHLIRAGRANVSRSLIAGGAGSLLVCLVSMVAVRDIVRQASLAPPVLQPATWVVPQWGAIAVFGVLLAGAIVTVAWMVHVLVRARA